MERKTYTVYDKEFELKHYGVKGMKWGHRKNPNLAVAKSNYKTAQKAYTKAYKKAYDRSLAALSPFKKHRQNNDKRWEDAFDKARELNSAKKAYKTAKKAAKADSKARKAAAKALKKPKNSATGTLLRHDLRKSWLARVESLVCGIVLRMLIKSKPNSSITSISARKRIRLIVIKRSVKLQNGTA